MEIKSKALQGVGAILLEQAGVRIIGVMMVCKGILVIISTVK